MANEKEIRTKIGSVKNTQKITKAMEMVAASKMRRTQETMKKALPYADKIRAVIGHIYNATQTISTHSSRSVSSKPQGILSSARTEGFAEG